MTEDWVKAMAEVLAEDAVKNINYAEVVERVWDELGHVADIDNDQLDNIAEDVYDRVLDASVVIR